MNSIVLLGRTTNSIELKQTQAGKSVATFSLAVKRPFTKDTTDFFNLTAWDKQAEIMAKHVAKGDQIVISGYLQNRSWTDKDGNKRTATDVVVKDFYFCGAKNTAQATNAPAPTNYIPEEYFAPPKGTFEDAEADPDIPF